MEHTLRLRSHRSIRCTVCGARYSLFATRFALHGHEESSQSILSRPRFAQNNQIFFHNCHKGVHQSSGAARAPLFYKKMLPRPIRAVYAAENQTSLIPLYYTIRPFRIVPFYVTRSIEITFVRFRLFASPTKRAPNTRIV